MNSWKAFSASCWLWKHFPAKSCRDTWRSGSQLARGQVNMADEARLRSPIRPAFKTFIVQRAVGRCCGEELGSFCWPMPAAGVSVFHVSHWFTEHTSRCNGFTKIQNTVVGQTGSRPPNSGHDLFLVQVWPWEVLWSSFSVQLLHWLSPVVIKIHFLSHITILSRNGSLLSHRIRGDNTSKWQFFWFAVSSCGTHLSSFFTFPIASNAECPLNGWQWALGQLLFFSGIFILFLINLFILIGG